MGTDQWDLTGKVALVTGAARGIGFGVSQHLASAGATVVVTGRGENVGEAGEKLSADHPDIHVVTAQLDVTQTEQWDEAVKSVTHELGRIDILVNNAGGFVPRCQVVEMSDDDWDFMFNVNMKSVFYGCRAVAPTMVAQEEGTIVNIGSFFGEIPQPLFSSYCTTKAAVKAFSQSLALELAPHGVTVNCIAPGFTESDMYRDALVGTAEFDGITVEEAEANVLGMIPAGRVGTGAEIGATVQFLASPGGRYFTAQSLIQGGGVLYR
jgi:NAD(P)-dependent dehydrogenase (short-subunit alcohol dehydrogenase family)